MFRNRGSLPNIGRSGKRTKSGGGDARGFNAPHYRYYWNGRFVVIQYDKNFLMIEIIITLLVLAIAFAAYLYSYKPNFNDQIADLKNNFLMFQLICIIASIALLIFFTFISKSKESLIRNLKFVAILSAVAIICQLGIKLSLDSNYNKETFANMYDQYESQGSEKDNKKQVVVGIFSGVQVSSVKDTYIQNCLTAYKTFKIKTILYIGLYILIVFLMFYLIHRLKMIEDKKERLEKDDNVVYDDEENVKM